jgi:hypothetical protein
VSDAIQKSAVKSVIDSFVAEQRGEAPGHSERSASAVADSLAEIVVPSAAEVCEADAEPEITTFVSLTLTLPPNEGVETAIACIVSTGLGVAFGLFKKTRPETFSEILESVYIAVDVAVGVGDPTVVAVAVAVAVAVGVAPPVEVAVAVGVIVGVALVDGVAVGVDVPVTMPLPESFTL